MTQGFGQNFLRRRSEQPCRERIPQQTQGFLPNGEVVNTRDLSNQVTVVADTNTNSLIVVTAPEYAEIVKRIVDQLDKIPQQVLIETVIVEASLTAADKLGVTFASSSSDGNTSSTIGGVFNNVGSTVTNDQHEQRGFPVQHHRARTTTSSLTPSSRILNSKCLRRRRSSPPTAFRPRSTSARAFRTSRTRSPTSTATSATNTHSRTWAWSSPSRRVSRATAMCRWT